LERKSFPDKGKKKTIFSSRGCNMSLRKLEFKDGKSAKFWHIELTGDSHTVSYGRLGSTGQTNTKTFGSHEAARKDYDKLVASKLKKGYTDAVPGAAEVAREPEPTPEFSQERAEVMTSAENEAPQESWPVLLRQPPWQQPAPGPGEKIKARKYPLRISWKDELEPLCLIEELFYVYDDESWKAKLQEAMAKAGRDRTELLAQIASAAPQETASAALTALLELEPKAAEPASYYLAPILANLGEPALPLVESQVKHLKKGHIETVFQKVAVAVASDSLAKLAVETATKKHSSCKVANPRIQGHAWRWLVRHSEAAAYTLIPDYFGSNEKKRSRAEGLLIRMIEAGCAPTLEAVAREYGVNLTAIYDPRSPFHSRLPNLDGTFPKKESLPPLMLKDGSGALGQVGVSNLVCMLATSSLENVYPDLPELLSAFTANSKSHFCRKLLDLWWAGGASAKHTWAVTATAWMGDAASARHLASLLREWPQGSHHMRATIGLATLVALDSTSALSELFSLGLQSKSREVQKAAQRRVLELAERKNLSVDQLGDRLIPHVDPDTEFGREVRAREVRRLQSAMRRRRRWSIAEFKEYLVDHPLVSPLVRALVWGAVAPGHPPQSFMVAEDGTYSDSEERRFQPDPEAQIGVMHRWELRDEEADIWQEHLSKLGVAQSFEQLNRKVVLCPNDHWDKRRLDCWSGFEVPSRQIVDLVERGWDYGEEGDDVSSMVKQSEEGQTVELLLEEGLLLGRLHEHDPQSLDDLTVHDGTFGELDPIFYSELMLDLEGLGVNLSDSSSSRADGEREKFLKEGPARQTKTRSTSQISPDSDFEIHAKDGSVLVNIPAGPFLYGKPEGPFPFGIGEPQKEVHLEAYSIGRYPVTNAQFRRFVEESGYHAGYLWQREAQQNGEQAPVLCVSLEMAEAYCEWAGLRLPSDEEWEKAARGTDGRYFPWGNEQDERARERPKGPVGAFTAGVSPYGCLDMGFLTEWTSTIPEGYSPPARYCRGLHQGEYCCLTYFRDWDRGPRKPLHRGFRCTVGGPS
jgi:formylglycine-generating enzyme required for sulfatase activity/predicted DNA-binding WGR domain protein